MSKKKNGRSVQGEDPVKSLTSLLRAFEISPQRLDGIEARLTSIETLLTNVHALVRHTVTQDPPTPSSVPPRSRSHTSKQTGPQDRKPSKCSGYGISEEKYRLYAPRVVEVLNKEEARSKGKNTSVLANELGRIPTQMALRVCRKLEVETGLVKAISSHPTVYKIPSSKYREADEYTLKQKHQGESNATFAH